MPSEDPTTTQTMCEVPRCGYVHDSPGDAALHAAFWRIEVETPRRIRVLIAFMIFQGLFDIGLLLYVMQGATR